MKEKINKTLAKISSDTVKANSPIISNEIKTTLGDPNCPHCHGVGYIRYDVPMGDPRFGRVDPCVCRAAHITEDARNRMFKMSHLERLNHLTFENFETRGNRNAKFITPQEIHGLQTARDAAENFAHSPQGWLLLEGSNGCGKTHLAAAIANYTANIGKSTLFITVPDLLSLLRSTFNDPDTTFESRFDEIINTDLLIIDDFGTQNATGWAQEKLFQIMNYRYINKLPTVINTNLVLDEIESRIRSRLQDEGLVLHVRITAPDYRRPNETSNPSVSMLSLPEIKTMTFRNFETREDELGKEDVTTVTLQKQDRFGNKIKETEIRHVKVTQEDLKTLRKAVNAAVIFAEEPEGWLVLLGSSFSGKTHLAAAIGNYRIDLGGQAILVEVGELLDYMRQTFRPASEVSFDRRFNEIKTTPMLILDDLKESGASSVWAEDKLDQIINHRYYAHLPTVITSTLRPEAFAINYPGMWNKILDASKSKVYVIDMPPYRRIVKAIKSAAERKSKAR